MANVLTTGAWLSAPSKKSPFFARLLRAQIDARQWAISARGFNSTTSNKLLAIRRITQESPGVEILDDA